MYYIINSMGMAKINQEGGVNDWISRHIVGATLFFHDFLCL